MLNEADIGSGEKPAAQEQVEREQRGLGGEIERREAAAGDECTLQVGDHLARFATRVLEDGAYEAQVFVRLTREPETAETYIPVGIFQTEEEARKAAEERARRALEDQEF